jgi:hypothetical protein
MVWYGGSDHCKLFFKTSQVLMPSGWGLYPTHDRLPIDGALVQSVHVSMHSCHVLIHLDIDFHSGHVLIHLNIDFHSSTVLVDVIHKWKWPKMWEIWGQNLSGNEWPNPLIWLWPLESVHQSCIVPGFKENLGSLTPFPICSWEPAKSGIGSLN